MPPDVVCRITQSQTSPENTSVAPLPPQSEPIAPENITAWERGRRARMPGVQALRPHTAIHSITPAPHGCAGFQPACRVHRHCARTQRYTPSPLHRLGAQASRPHAGCTGIAPAHSDTPHHPCTAWVRRRRARMPGAQALRPHTAIHPITPAPPGCAGFQPACRVRRRRARMPGAQASRPHTAIQPIRGRDALIPRRVYSPRCEQLHNPLSYCFTAGIVLYCDPILG
jgi:hypothetical protein